MFRSLFCASVMVVCCWVPSATGSRLLADLTKNQLKELETVFAPAYAMGNTPVVLESLGKVVSRMTDEQLDELDGLFAEKGIPAPSQLLVTARLNLLRQGVRKGLRRPTNRELILMLAHVDTVTTSLIEMLDQHADAIEELNTDNSFDEFESLLWDSHVLGQRLNSGRVLAQYAAEMVKKYKRTKIDELEPAQRALMEKDFDHVDQTLAGYQKDLNERELITRIKRIELAASTLGKPVELKEKYKAAWAIGIDGRLVNDELSSDEVEFKLPFLNNDKLLETVTKQVEQGRVAAGDQLLKKSNLLGTGLHWWIRGRYGMGTEGFGLLKSMAALTSPEAEFALYMPQTPPTPTDPAVSEGYNIPEIDRRHNYIWAWEYREVRIATQETRAFRQDSRLTSVTEMSRFY